MTDKKSGSPHLSEERQCEIFNYWHETNGESPYRVLAEKFHVSIHQIEQAINRLFALKYPKLIEFFEA